MNPRSHVVPDYQGGMIRVLLLGDVESSCGLSKLADTASSLETGHQIFPKNAWRMAAATPIRTPKQRLPKNSAT